jgi:hypothetical protein
MKICEFACPQPISNERKNSFFKLSRNYVKYSPNIATPYWGIIALILMQFGFHSHQSTEHFSMDKVNGY